MSSTIKPKLEQQLNRQLSQQTSERKSELASHHVEDLKNLGKSIKQSHSDQRAVANSVHAVNHIRTRAVNPNSTEEDSIASTDNTRLYTRQGRMEKNENATNEDEASADQSLNRQEIESAATRLEKHNEEKARLVQANELARADDSFYKVEKRGNTMTEDTQGYYIDAYAPEHEKAGVRVSVTHNKAVISGSRKAQNEVQSERGKMATNNFQTFREEFDFGTPVSAAGMTRERDGDFIRFFIPKLTSHNESKDES